MWEPHYVQNVSLTSEKYSSVYYWSAVPSPSLGPTRQATDADTQVVNKGVWAAGCGLQFVNKVHVPRLHFRTWWLSCHFYKFMVIFGPLVIANWQARPHATYMSLTYFTHGRRHGGAATPVSLPSPSTMPYHSHCSTITMSNNSPKVSSGRVGMPFLAVFAAVRVSYPYRTCAESTATSNSLPYY